MGNEELRPGWAIEGTTGYGFLNLLNGLFVDASKAHFFQRLYRKFTGWSQSYADLIYESKRLVMQVSMSSELNVLSRRLDRISEQHRRSRDFTLESLRDALREVIACFPVYRTYIRSDTQHPDEQDERYIRSAIKTAKRRNPATSGSVFDFIQDLLLLNDPDSISDADRAERRLFVMRFQQLTGPVMAKGLEDTAFYRYCPLLSLNEVGGSPDRFGVALAHFHAKNLARRQSWRNAMLASSTHDTKRSEDVRARINVLSEIPAEWYRAIRTWQRLNEEKKIQVAGESVPSANEEYFLYQTLLGAWPLAPMDSAARADFVGRIHTYMEKALREAKVNTSWIRSQHGIRSRGPQLSRQHPGQRGRQAFPRPVCSLPGQHCEGRNVQFAFSDPAEDYGSGSSRSLPGNGSLELQPGRSRQSPAGGLRTAAGYAGAASRRRVR